MIEWFGGNQAAFNMYEMLKDLAHTWDDIVDGEPRTEYDINQAFAVALLHLPLNPFYRQIQDTILPMWEMVISAYETANQFEREKSPHGLEIAHGLRYAAGHIAAFAIIRCVGYEKAREYLPLMWKDIVFERFSEYLAEHIDGWRKESISSTRP